MPITSTACCSSSFCVDKYKAKITSNAQLYEYYYDIEGGGGGSLINIFLKRRSILLHIYLITTVVTVWHGNSLILLFLPIFKIIFQGEISKGLVDFLVKLLFNTCKWRYSMAMFSPVNAGGVLKPDKEGC